MSSATQASFFWVNYGFDSITPPKMYNSNVSCAVLQSFVKNTCAKDVENLCKHKNIQLGIELDALKKNLQASQAQIAATQVTGTPDFSSVRPEGIGSPSGVSSSRATAAPTLHAAVNTIVDDEMSEIIAKKTANENQFKVVAAASKLARALIAGTAVIDLVDDHGKRLKLDESGHIRANSIIKSRVHYTAVAVTVDDTGSPHVAPLVFDLQKPSTDNVFLVKSI